TGSISNTRISTLPERIWVIFMLTTELRHNNHILIHYAENIPFERYILFFIYKICSKKLVVYLTLKIFLKKSYR
ncbi:MAG: hypothetical protein ACI9RZ_001534, partial [Sphingobacteriales bacterium]